MQDKKRLNIVIDRFVKYLKKITKRKLNRILKLEFQIRALENKD